MERDPGPAAEPNDPASGDELWGSMFDVAPTGLALVRLDGHYERVNAALCRILGYSAEELLSTTFQKITHPDDLGTNLDLARQLLAGEIEGYVLEKRYKHAHGRDVWVQLSVALLRDPAGAPSRYVTSMEDVTARRLAEGRLAAIIAGASDAFVGIAANGYVTEWNAAAEKLFGWSRAEAFGQPLVDMIIPAEQRAAHEEGLARLARGGAGRILNQAVELKAMTRDGRVLPVELTVWRADGPTGAAGGSGDSGGEFYAFIRDTTERVRAAERQREIAAAQLAIADVELSPQKVMHEVCLHAQSLTGAEAASVEIVDGEHLVYQAATGFAEPSRGLRLRIDGSLSGLAFTTGQTLHCTDSLVDPRVDQEAARQTGARSLIAVPLRRAGQVHGVMKVWSTRPQRFNDEDCSTLNLLAAPFGAALANAWKLEATANQAVTDPLTGLGNRSLALKELHRALLRQGRRASGHTAVMFIDLDRFKNVNDTFGHSAGDEVLVSVARKLQLAMRSTDTCSRLGGDEFLVLCENVVARDDVTVLAERLVQLVAGAYPITRGNEIVADVELGASIGIAITGRLVPDGDLLHAADQAMYEAKKSGGTAFQIRHL